MKIIIKISLVLAFFIGIASDIWAQSLPPKVWFTCDHSDGINSKFGSMKLFASAGVIQQHSPDRFGIDIKALRLEDFFESRTNGFFTIDSSNFSTPVKLFGYSKNAEPLPENFTISCWVRVTPTDTLPRKIYFTNDDASGFALIHKGSKIYLRRKVGDVIYYDYEFGAPASFDAGEGWYHVVLVMGKRTVDKAPYTKIYVGKPNQVKYDATGPRVVLDTSDKLALNFGAAYAFTGVQPFMLNHTWYGLGNVHANDPVHGTNITMVKSIDDFMVWGTALDDNQVKALIDCQRVNVANQCWPNVISSSSQPSPELITMASLIEEMPTTGELSAFPNPTSGELWVRIPELESGSGQIKFRLLDLHGRQLWTNQINVSKQGQLINLGNVRSYVGAAGVYFLQVDLPEKSKTLKVMIQ